jgi:pyruvate kinase
MRRTKILATLGPASREPQVLDALIAAGLDAVRLNFSHGTHEAHAETYRRVRDAAERAGRPIAVLQDLQGPKVRLGVVKGQMEVATGSQLTITTRKVEGADGVVSTEYSALPSDVRPGDVILLDEGRVAVRVKEVRGEDILCQVEDGGVLSSNKGINVPGAMLTAAAMTEKDERDVRFGLALGVDFVALSFVRRAEDVEQLRRCMAAEGRSVPIVAKIEKPQAIDALDAIVAAADGVMVARGDLGVEVPLETIPAHQKRIIARANLAGKLVITATQMLESMTENPIPTRAEVTDVANAVLDGTDAVMLSGETAVGRYPVEAVRRMAAIAETTEELLQSYERPVRGSHPADQLVASALCRLAGQACREVAAKAAVVLTRSGSSAALLSDERPRAPIVALCTEPALAARLALYWGVAPRPFSGAPTARGMMEAAARIVASERLADKDDTVVLLLGSETDPDLASALKIARVGDLPAA